MNFYFNFNLNKHLYNNLIKTYSTNINLKQNAKNFTRI